jgi:hypothetical protein
MNFLRCSLSEVLTSIGCVCVHSPPNKATPSHQPNTPPKKGQLLSPPHPPQSSARRWSVATPHPPIKPPDRPYAPKNLRPIPREPLTRNVSPNPLSLEESHLPSRQHVISTVSDHLPTPIDPRLTTMALYSIIAITTNSWCRTKQQPCATDVALTFQNCPNRAHLAVCSTSLPGPLSAQRSPATASPCFLCSTLRSALQCWAWCGLTASPTVSSRIAFLTSSPLPWSRRPPWLVFGLTRAGTFPFAALWALGKGLSGLILCGRLKPYDLRTALIACLGSLSLRGGSRSNRFTVNFVKAPFQVFWCHLATCDPVSDPHFPLAVGAEESPDKCQYPAPLRPLHGQMRPLWRDWKTQTISSSNVGLPNSCGAQFGNCYHVRGTPLALRMFVESCIINLQK